MPAKVGYLRKRAENFCKGLKRAVQSLSPRKRRKVSETDKENEPAKASTSPSDISILPDVFLALPPLLPAIFPRAIFTPYGSYFHQNTQPDVPVVNSMPSDHDTPAFQKAAAADPAAQDVESRGTSKGYKDPKVDPFIKHRLESMHIFLNQYTDPRSKTYGHWGASVLQTAVGLARGRHCVRTVCKLARQYIHDREILPINPYGEWKDSLLIDEDLAADINLHLQEIGNHITSEKLVQYLSQPEVMAKHGITKKISVSHGRAVLGGQKRPIFRWTERRNVVCERDTK
ncbi:hypothetical protein B0H17DRAFT_1146544 [Mycena rosella]|uniref:Uncharacterized protein n=1 Tax=Mycena rosella TaxID=1033263 RepID=A0AAD7CNP6_MYCRO|nr:hypothetical protein B0H17DRAFT_1146544 [Mycena rosella]